MKFLNILPSFVQQNIENGKRSHRIGKFNILSVNVILFQGKQKNIRVGLWGRNNADSGLFTKKFERFPTIRGKRNFSSRTDVFLKSQLFSKSTLNFARFDTKFVAVRKILLSASRQGRLGNSI